MGKRGLILINFSHPFSEAQVDAIEAITGITVEEVIHRPAQFDPELPFAAQARNLVNGMLMPDEWQTALIVVNPPAMSSIACVVLAELHGRMGYFPPIVRMRRVENILPPTFEVAEIINLQGVRDDARSCRKG